MTLFMQRPRLELVEETYIPKTIQMKDGKRICNLHSLKTSFGLVLHSLYSFVDAEK